MKSRPRIGHRLVKAFLLQVGFISLAVLLGIYAAKLVLDGILIQRALREEAEYFWQRYQADPDIPLPDTLNMKAYLLPRQDRQQIPADLRELSTGFHKLPSKQDFTAAYISSNAGNAARLILVFDGRRVEEFALFFGMVPLALVLIVLYTAALISYRLSQRAVSPIIQLAHKVSRIDTESPDKGLLALEHLPEASDQEVLALSEALARLSARLRRFIERERTFTRDVSHELRSPITVIRIASDLLLSQQLSESSVRDKVSRIQRAAKEMEELTDAFLLLARESENRLSQETLCVNDVAAAELELARSLSPEKPVNIEMAADGRLWVSASNSVLSVLIGNLIRNAVAYTKAGYVRMNIQQDRLCIEDSGVGIAHDQIDQVFQPFFRGVRASAGHGVGLAIVKRFSDRFDWPIEISSQIGVGTRVIVHFPQARFEPYMDMENGKS
jgi:signal transduction histidine kinase